MVNIPKEHISLKKVYVDTTNVATQIDSPKVYYKIKPEIGKTLIWPAEWTHAHKGEILKSGIKYIITGWMHFPFNFKN